MEAFNLKDALNGSPVKTRDGRKISNVRVVGVDAINNLASEPEPTQALMAEIHNDCGLCDYPFYSDGIAHKYRGLTGADLMMVNAQVN